MRHNFNFNHLECFLLTAQSLSFSQTALSLKIAQPAVSRQIQQLETSLGVQLFLRTKKQVLLTEEGKILQKKISPLYEKMRFEMEGFMKLERGPTGVLKLGCLTEVGERVFMEPLSAFKKKYPDLKIEMQFLKAYEIKEKVKAGSLDLGILSENILQENIRSHEIFHEDIILVTNPANAKKRISKLKDLPFVAYRDNDPLLTLFMRKLSPKTKQSSIQVEMMVNSHKAMRQLILDHPYYAVLPRLSVKKDLEKGSLVQVGNMNVDSKLYLIQREMNIPEPKKTSFSQFLLEWMKANKKAS